MLTLKIIIFGLIFIASGGAAFSQLFRDKVWMQVVAGVIGSLSVIFMIREMVRDEMRTVQPLPQLPVVSAPLVSQPVVPPPQPAVSVESAPSEEVVGNVFQDQLKDGGLGPKMVLIPAGRFEMGSNDYDDEKPLHWVTVEKFAMGQYEVTFEEYDRFAQATGRAEPNDEGWGRGKRPVINVDWNDAVAYTEWLSQQTGQTYRLPTESEWEYAARAGTTTNYWWGNEIGRNHANCDGCGSQWDNQQTAPVGSFKANPFGLYDTAGNVWEWTCSRYTNKYDGNELKCDATNESWHVLRGGSWNNLTHSCRAADRVRLINRNGNLGFRVVVLR